MLESPLLYATSPEALASEPLPSLSAQADMKRRLERSMVIALVFMVVEIVGGVWAGSLAIVTDAAHVLSDVSGIAVSLFALALMAKKPTVRYTYGFHQAEILGALISVMTVWAMTGVLLFEAYRRFLDLQEIDGQVMVGMAVLGIAVNGMMILGLGGLHHHHGGHGHDHGHGHSHGHEDHQHDEEGGGGHQHHHSPGHVCGGDHHHVQLEEDQSGTQGRGTHGSMVMRAAVIHLIGDVIQSVGVLIAAMLIWWQPLDLGHTANGVSHWNYADPLCTVVFSGLVMYTTYSTVRECVGVLMQRVPEDVDAEKFEDKLKEIEGVSCVHDIHIWSVGSSNGLCTAHVVVKEEGMSSRVLEKCRKIAANMDLHHSTFQIEVEGVFDHFGESFGNLHGRKEECC